MSNSDEYDEKFGGEWKILFFVKFRVRLSHFWMECVKKCENSINLR